MTIASHTTLIFLRADSGQVILREYERLLNERTKIVAISHVSNALGTIVPIQEMTALAHRYQAKVLVDGAQAVAHVPVDVQAIDCDFYVFSGHKIFAPTGIGALFGKEDILKTMAPYQGGGNMIADVTFDKTVYQSAPARFEAGTPSIGDAVGLGAALNYVSDLGRAALFSYEHDLLAHGTELLREVPGLKIIGTAKEKTSVLSFIIAGFKPEYIGKFLSERGIAVRAGHHCAQPILRRFGQESTVRASLSLYNTRSELEYLAEILQGMVASNY